MPDCLRKADRRRHAGIRHRHDHVGVGRRLARELARPWSCARRRRCGRRRSNPAARNRCIRRCRAAAPSAGTACANARRPRRTPRTSPFSTSRTYLRADDVERAGLRGEDRAAVELAEHQRADAERIARADQLLVGQADEGIGAFELAQALDEAVDEAVAPRARHQMQDHLGVGGRLHHRAFVHQLRGAASRPLVRLPLWPMAKPPPSSSANSGCTLRRMVSPVVE